MVSIFCVWSGIETTEKGLSFFKKKSQRNNFQMQRESEIVDSTKNDTFMHRRSALTKDKEDKA